jgi:hypothetical protein
MQTHGLQVAVRGSYSFIDFDGKRFFRFGEGADAIDGRLRAAGAARSLRNGVR